jgi:hypothetical protein
MRAAALALALALLSGCHAHVTRRVVLLTGCPEARVRLLADLHPQYVYRVCGARRVYRLGRRGELVDITVLQVP